MNAFPFRALRMAVATLLSASALTLPILARAQQPYRNIVNQRFQTVSNGPQSGIVVDVKDVKDTVGVQRAVKARVRATLRAQSAVLSKEIDLLRRRHLLKGNPQFPLTQVVYLRQNGRLVTAQTKRSTTRDDRSGNDLHINIVTQGQGAFDPASKSYRAVVAFLQPNSSGQPALYGELKNILGAPFSNFTVNINNSDPDPDSTTFQSVRGAIIQVDVPNSLINIDLPTFVSDQDTFLALAQTLAQCFYAPKNFGYDVWNQGIARAAAVIAAQDFNANQFFNTLGGFDPVDPVSGFYYTPYYDQLNQPSLGNPVFLPTSLQASKPVSGTLAGMFIPRLQMASTAFTKLYTESNGSFFQNFNSAYYAAVSADDTVRMNTGALRDLAAGAVSSVEGQPFTAWYTQQYIFDTSVTPGPKLFAYSFPTFPDSSGNAGAAILLVYYGTDKSGNESPLSGVVNPVYFDYAYQNRLILSNGNAQEPINSGLGSASPFFTGIGSTDDNSNRQRLAIDFPVSSNQAGSTFAGGNEYTRIYFPANEETINGVASDYSGVLIGAQKGLLTTSFNGGSNPIQVNANFGAFVGQNSSGAIPTGFSKVTFTFLPDGSNTPLTFYRDTFTRKDNPSTPTVPGISPIFVLNTGLNQAPASSLVHTPFFNGPQMVSLPLQLFPPYSGNLPLLFSSAPGTPDANAQLIAQYRQDASSNSGKYLNYPSMPLYQPGFSFWTNFAGDLNNLDLSKAGKQMDDQDLISVPLQFGWNMIGNPYTANITISDSADNPGIQVQYQNGDALTLQEAIDTGLVAAGVFGYQSNQNVMAYQDITQATTTTTGLPQNQLVSWSGYWIRVLVTEGVTLSYQNPTPATGTGRGAAQGKPRTRAFKRTRASGHVAEQGGWRLPLLIRDSAGNASGALLGQSPKGSDGFVAALDAASPPPFTRNASLSVRFPHVDWDNGKGSSNTGDFLSDIRRAGSKTQWDVVVNTPKAEQPYTLTWNSTTKLPRGMRLTLIDGETGARRVMNSASSYTFTPGKGATARKFQVLAEPRATGRLVINNLHVETRQSRGVATTALISYDLTGAAELSIDVVSGTGRRLRQLVSGRTASVGTNQVAWDLKDDQGRALPTGTYLIQVSARTSEGETARMIVPHPITR